MVITFPNILTLSRILAVPFFAIKLRCGHITAACIIFFAAGLTDVLDGYLARRLNQRSKLGALLDPIADKLLINTALIALALTKEPWVAQIPLWIVATAIARDITIIIAGIATYRSFNSNKFKPSLLGKMTTFVELAAISLSLSANILKSYTWCQIVAPWIYNLMAGMVIASGIHYFFRETDKNS
jgi:cardiolipin synthase